MRVGLAAIALVFAGGTLGTAAREALVLTFPPLAGIPWTIFVINVLGAFALGLLLEALTRSESRTPVRRVRTLRLLVGTGFLGGFTTYSALAMDSVLILTGNAPGAAPVGPIGIAEAPDAAAWALAYALLTAVIGTAAAGSGVVAGDRLGSRRAGSGSGHTSGAGRGGSAGTGSEGSA